MQIMDYPLEAACVAIGDGKSVISIIHVYWWSLPYKSDGAS